MKKGVVTKSTGSWYSVRLETGELVNCRILGKFRLDGKKLTNPIAVGDEVDIRIETDQETGIIEKILPRKNYIVRQSPRKKHFLHLLCSNIDQAFLLTTIKSPALKPGFIDRFLLMTTPHNIPTYIIINKSDLYDEGDLEVFQGLKAIYESIGYPVLLVSAESGEGVQTVKDLLAEKLTFVSGHSGVGKSTLVNAIHPEVDLKTLEISDYSGKGQHSTTFAEMYFLDNGGAIIDTPGIKELAFINMEPQDVAHNFVEFFEASKRCKFDDCMHMNEPKCAVKNGIDAGEISELRYLNYLKIMEEIKSQNYWERNSDW